MRKEKNAFLFLKQKNKKTKNKEKKENKKYENKTKNGGVCLCALTHIQMAHIRHHETDTDQA
jgi:hypothetical protein